MKSSKRSVVLALAVFAGLAWAGSIGWTWWQAVDSGAAMQAAADAFLASLTAEQRAVAVMDYAAAARVDWHFIPKPQRKGVQFKELSPPQRTAALALLRSALSENGYQKATTIMQLEGILRELEKDKAGGNIRDPERYYFTVFGQPAADTKWGLSIEGHHLSLNFVVDKGRVVSSTPTVFAANPATVKEPVIDAVKVGTRVLAREEELAFDLLRSLTAEQRRRAIIAEKAPADVRAAGEAQPPQTPAEGISYGELDLAQQGMLRELVMAYARNLPPDVAQQRMSAIREARAEPVHFAWAGPDQPGIGHYYRVQGPTFVIEFCNTQPDAAGNPANHIHSLWRDIRGDFAIPVKP